MLDFASLGTTEQELNKLLSKTKIHLFMKRHSAFLASLMGQLRFVWTLGDAENPTAATDGESIWWDAKFFLGLPKESRVTVLAHELWHVAYHHMSRLKGRHPEKWNIAGDHVINLQLEAEDYSFETIEWALRDPDFLDLSTEAVYELLPDPPPPPTGGGGGSVPAPLSGDLRPTQTKEQEMAVMAKVITAVQAAKISNQAGDIPGEITLLIEKFLKPKLPWQQLLRRWFTERNKQDYSWRVPSRRHDDFLLPSLISEDQLMGFNAYEDISGSVSDANILRFNSEFAHIKREYNPEMMRLCTFDTQIQDTWEISEFQAFEKIEVTGRGGTDLRPVRDHILKTRPTFAIIFTDLECHPMDPVPCPVLWICVGNSNATVPFGTLIHIDDEPE